MAVRSWPQQRASSSAPPAAATGLLFGVTEDDVAALDESEFSEVWMALGKVARARAKAKAIASAEASTGRSEPDDADDDGDDA